jgi:transcription initiation factor TFIIIB Brf1 subunit/transcription initiation factor TFIIB
MNRVILQVPMKKELRDQAEIAAKNNGFSSLQEVVRVLLSKLTKKEIAIRVAEPEERLSARAARKYDKIVEQIKNGTIKTIPFDSTKDLMNYLSK